MIEKYMMDAHNIEKFSREVDKLNKRAAKLGVPAILFRKTGVINLKEIKNEFTGAVIRVERRLEIEVSGVAPKYAGWQLAAVLEVAEGGVIIRKSPNCKAELAQYRATVHKCDHCKLERNRAETFICIHDDGSTKQIGRQCIKDFLGHTDPHQLAKWAELMFSLGELASGCEDGDFFGEGGGGTNRDLVHTGSVLSYAALVIRMKGYVSVQRERDDYSSQTTSTRSTAQAWMNPGRNDKLGVNYFIPEPQDKERGEIARQYILDTLGERDAAKLSDFENNLLVACKSDVVDKRNAGMLCYVPEYFARETEKRVKAEAEAKTPACHFGTVGQKVAAEKLVYLKSTGFDSAYGWTFLHSFQHASGARILWKTGTELDLTNGEEVNAKFTVKAHDTYNGFPQTKVLRMKVWNDRMVCS